MEFAQTSKKTLWISVTVGAFIILGVGWYMVRIRPERQRAAAVAEQVARQLEKQEQAIQAVTSPPVLPVENIAPPSNPVKEKVPEINPLERVNPFSEVFVNPFE